MSWSPPDWVWNLIEQVVCVVGEEGGEVDLESGSPDWVGIGGGSGKGGGFVVWMIR